MEFAAVNSAQRALHIADRSGHVVTVDHDGPVLSRAIADFMQRQIVRDRLDSDWVAASRAPSFVGSLPNAL